MPAPTPETHYPPACYSEDKIWQGYRAALKFDSPEDLAEELGTEVRFYNLWLKRYPAFKAAIDLDKLNLDIETRAKLIESSREAGIIDVDGLVIEANGVSRLN